MDLFSSKDHRMIFVRLARLRLLDQFWTLLGPGSSSDEFGDSIIGGFSFSGAAAMA